MENQSNKLSKVRHNCRASPDTIASMTVTKADLAATIALQTDIPQKQATACVDVILAGITDALLQGDKVELRGFGSFRYSLSGRRCRRRRRVVSVHQYSNDRRRA
jgi:nucleoid DNA-binding protein